MIRERDLCPISEIDWQSVFRGREPTPWERLADDEPVPGGELHGIEAMVAQYRAGYPDERRKSWIEARLRAWWKGQG